MLGELRCSDGKSNGDQKSLGLSSAVRTSKRKPQLSSQEKKHYWRFSMALPRRSAMPDPLNAITGWNWLG
jgi:hypothetical protein